MRRLFLVRVQDRVCVRSLHDEGLTTDVPERFDMGEAVIAIDSYPMPVATAP